MGVRHHLCPPSIEVNSCKSQVCPLKKKEKYQALFEYSKSVLLFCRLIFESIAFAFKGAEAEGQAEDSDSSDEKHSDDEAACRAAKSRDTKEAQR